MMTAPMPADVEQRIRRRGAAIRWRVDHVNDPNRDSAWAMFRAGALWRSRPDERRPITLALNDAERTVPFGLLAPLSP